MDFIGLLRSRRSIRRFTNESVPDAVIERLIDVATFAPSAHNRQPWRFAVVTGAAAKAQVADAMGAAFRKDLEEDGLSSEEVEARVERSGTRIKTAPVLIILCMDMSDMDHYPDPVRQTSERTMGLQSVAMAGLQLLLAAQAEGLGGVWSCGPLFAPGTVSQALGLPETWEAQGMLLIGHPVENPPARPRRPVGEITLFR